MFTAGGTGGGPGSGSFNLELAQFQQMVANAEMACRACNGNSCKAKKFCKKLVCCKYYPAGANQLAVAAQPDCCAAAQLDLSTCTTSCSQCDRCGGQCKYVPSETSTQTTARHLSKKSKSKSKKAQ